MLLGVILNSAVAVVATALIPSGDGEAPTQRVNGIDGDAPSRVDEGNKRIQDALKSRSNMSMLARASEMFNSAIEEVAERDKREQKKRRRMKALQTKVRQKEARKLKVKGRRFLRDLSGERPH